MTLNSHAAALVAANPDDSLALLRLPMVLRFTGLGRSTIYRLMAKRRFPPPVRLSDRVVAWRRSDLERWSADRPTAQQ